MLPTFGTIIQQREEANAAYFRKRVRQIEPLLDQIPGHIIHEGKSTALIRPSGEKEPTEIHSHSGSIEIERKRLLDFTLAYVHEKFDEMAAQMAKSFSKAVIAELEAGANKSGNIVDAKGKPFSQDLLLDILSKMSHSFDDKGNWQVPTMVVGSDQMKKIQEIYKNSTAGERAEYERRLGEIIAIKKAEYDSEQAGRILAG